MEGRSSCKRLTLDRRTKRNISPRNRLAILAVNAFLLTFSASAQINPYPPALLNTNGASDSAQDELASIATDNAGNWICVWESLVNWSGMGADYDILYSRSIDSGTTWSDPLPLNPNAVSDTGMDHEPVVSFSDTGVWLCVWRTNEDLLDSDGDWDLLASRSIDNGVNWSTPSLLNSNATTDTYGDYLPRIANDGAGNWICVWHSEEPISGTGTDYDILYSMSSDDGVSWNTVSPLHSNAYTDNGIDGAPDIATDGNGNWICVWGSNEDLLGAESDFDIFISRSSNNGMNWTAPSMLNTNAATDSGSDGGPRIDSDRAGNWICVWYSKEDISGSGSDTDILSARSTNTGTTWSTPNLVESSAAIDTGEDE